MQATKQERGFEMVSYSFRVTGLNAAFVVQQCKSKYTGYN